MILRRTRLPRPKAHDRHKSSRMLADAAVWALIQEVQLTPKPALVDGRGSGAHRDMNLRMLKRSARALHNTFFSIAARAFKADANVRLREDLSALGRAGEKVMLLETGGVNTHRGAIWTLGLLCAAAAMLESCARSAANVCMLAGRLARVPDKYQSPQPSHGSLAYSRNGVRGARGEAEEGFPHLVGTALPMLKKSRREGTTESQARLNALLGLMAQLDDTCLLHRGGPAALTAAQDGARGALDLGGTATSKGMRALLRLDVSLVRIGASPGGSADLLAGALLLEVMENEFCHSENQFGNFPF